MLIIVSLLTYWMLLTDWQDLVMHQAPLVRLLQLTISLCKIHWEFTILLNEVQVRLFLFGYFNKIFCKLLGPGSFISIHLFQQDLLQVV